jgi:hypothetical protein
MSSSNPLNPIDPQNAAVNGASMDITNILNSKGGAAAAQAAQQAQQHAQGTMQPDHSIPSHLLQAGPGQQQVKSEAGSEAGMGSPHGSELSRFSSQSHALGHMGSTGMNPNMRYPSPSAIPQGLAPYPMPQYRNDPFPLPGGDIPRSTGRLMEQNMGQGQGQPQNQTPAQKAFPCSSCGKGFARRSDLSRHGMLL